MNNQIYTKTFQTEITNKLLQQKNLEELKACPQVQMMSDLTILHKIVIQTELMNKRRSVQGILQVLCLLCCICVHNLCVLGTVFAYITDLED